MSQSSDDGLDSYLDNSATATLDTVDTPAAIEPTGNCCEKCNTPFTSEMVSVCRRCGWYPSLNQFIEVDHNFEAAHNDDPVATERPKPSHLQVWAKLLPPWSWVLIATVVAIIAESVFALKFTDGSTRMYWSIIQLAVGVALFAGCHFFNFLVAATEDTDVGFLDMFVKPIGLWLRAMRKLPRRLWMADGALAGATAVLASILIIGALPFDELFDAGPKPKKVNLLASVVKQAHQVPNQGGGNLAEMVGGVPADSGGASDNLEDAVGDFAGQQSPPNADGDSPGGAKNGAQAADDSTAEGESNQPKSPKYENIPGVRQKLVCVILGYRLDSRGRISSLVLGALHDGKLAYAGTVMPPADDANLIDLVDDLQRSRIEQPSIPLFVQANWVLPKYVCQVNYHEREADGRLIGVEWDKLRGTLTQSIYARPAPMSAGQ